MNTTILPRLFSVAAGLALPVSLFAQDLGNGPEGGVDTSSAQPSSQSGSYSSGGTFSTGTNQNQSQPGVFSGGIMVQDGAAYIVHRLQNPMSLPDGSKVQPNGTITEGDGSTKSLAPGQVMTLDGRVMKGPFPGDSMPPSSNSGVFTSPSTPGSSTSTGGNPPLDTSSGRSKIDTQPFDSGVPSTSFPDASSDNSNLGVPSTPGTTNPSDTNPESLRTESGNDFSD